MPKPEPKPKKLSDILHEMAGELVVEWAKANYHNLWVGGTTRKRMQEDIAKKLRVSYDLAKERYSKD